LRKRAYPLKSEAMKKRLLEAKNRRTGIPFEVVRETLAFDQPHRLSGLAKRNWMRQQDKSPIPRRMMVTFLPKM
jgi:hypothetical protein